MTQQVTPKKKILAIIGSASRSSSNQKLVDRFAELTQDSLSLIIYDDLKELPHFDPELSVENTPAIVLDLRNKIDTADGVLISTPEYIFSVPSGLKNALEWCVSTTVFTDKPVGVITASAHGAKGHEELLMIMRTIGAVVADDASLLVQGIRGKVNAQAEITDETTRLALNRFAGAFKKLVHANAR